MIRREEEAAAAATRGLEGGGRGATIIVPLDGSIEAKASLPVARLVSEITGAALRVVYVAEGERTQQQMLRELKLGRREETLGLMIDRVEGPPAEAIVRTARERQAMLIVMTTRGASDYQGRALRPVPEQVINAATCPMLLVRPENAPRLSQMKALRRILLPLDGAPSTMCVVGPAVSLADKSRAELDVLYVAQLNTQAAQEPGTLTTPRYIDQPQYEWPAWVQECVERFCAFIGECPPAAPTRVFVRYGEPSAEILQFASEHESDLIVLEWRGHLDPVHSGTTRDVLTRAQCPVLLLRTEGC